MDGKTLAERVRAEIAQDVAGLAQPVGLATVLVGEYPASEIYIKRKQEACREVGIEPFDHKLSASVVSVDSLWSNGSIPTSRQASCLRLM